MSPSLKLGLDFPLPRVVLGLSFDRTCKVDYAGLHAGQHIRQARSYCLVLEETQGGQKRSVGAVVAVERAVLK